MLTNGPYGLINTAILLDTYMKAYDNACGMIVNMQQIIEQIRDDKGDTLKIDDNVLKLLSGEKELSEVTLPEGANKLKLDDNILKLLAGEKELSQITLPESPTELFKVTITCPVSATYKSDKTFAEIKAAYDSGMMPYAEHNGRIYSLSRINTSQSEVLFENFTLRRNDDNDRWLVNTEVFTIFEDGQSFHNGVDIEVPDEEIYLRLQQDNKNANKFVQVQSNGQIGFTDITYQSVGNAYYWWEGDHNNDLCYLVSYHAIGVINTEQMNGTPKVLMPDGMAFPVLCIRGEMSRGTQYFGLIDANGISYKGSVNLSSYSGTMTKSI